MTTDPDTKLENVIWHVMWAGGFQRDLLSALACGIIIDTVLHHPMQEFPLSTNQTTGHTKSPGSIIYIYIDSL